MDWLLQNTDRITIPSGTTYLLSFCLVLRTVENYIYICSFYSFMSKFYDVKFHELRVESPVVEIRVRKLPQIRVLFMVLLHQDIEIQSIMPNSTRLDHVKVVKESCLLPQQANLQVRNQISNAQVQRNPKLRARLKWATQNIYQTLYTPKTLLSPWTLTRTFYLMMINK